MYDQGIDWKNQLRVVMVSTENDKLHIARALKSGADEYLMKPFTPEMISDKLRLVGM